MGPSGRVVEASERAALAAAALALALALQGLSKREAQAVGGVRGPWDGRMMWDGLVVLPLGSSTLQPF